MAETAIESGLRWGELTALRTHDLDTASRMLTVARAVTETTPGADGQRFAVKVYPKDKEHRRLNLSPGLSSALDRHRSEAALERTGLLFSFPMVENDGAVLFSPAQLSDNETQEPVGQTEPNQHGRTYPTAPSPPTPSAAAAAPTAKARSRPTGPNAAQPARIALVAPASCTPTQTDTSRHRRRTPGHLYWPGC